MKLFELYNKNSNIKAVVIGGQHGDEPIGVEICQKLADITPANDGLRIIPIANRPAFVAKKREFNGIDLNRAYGKNSTNILELDEMVDTIKNSIAEAEVVVDCHSTPIKDLQEIAVFPNETGKDLAPLMELPFYMQDPPENSLRHYCDSIGVPALTFEGIHELHKESVETGVAAILKLFEKMKII